MKDYHINIFYSDEDECYVADIPDLRYCSAFGDTPSEALYEVEIAKSLWLEVAAELGHDIPVPRYRPAIYSSMVSFQSIKNIPPTTPQAPAHL
jgi:predicted RNase H-like HicB family nuclease